MAIEIPSNEHWGRRYGAEYTPPDKKKSDGSWGWHFPKVGYGSPSSTSGKGVTTVPSASAKADKAKFVAEGRPTITVDWKNKRVH